MCIVDRLEAVEIDEQQRQRPPAARRALGFPPQHLVQIARVVQVREVVGDRQRLGALQLSSALSSATAAGSSSIRMARSRLGASRGSRADGFRSSATSAPMRRPRQLRGNARTRRGQLGGHARVGPQIRTRELLAVVHHPRRDCVDRGAHVLASGRDRRAPTARPTSPTTRRPSTARESRSRRARR